jgi:anthranilate synthase component I
MLVRVDDKGAMFTHPIAGTRRRGMDDAEDDALAAELLADEKERAEHIMLVDLGRNDLGRVATPGSVKVDSLMKVERYSHVMHIVSNLSAKLAPGKTAFDALRSVFPAGTVSGAPKVMAMQLVSSLERERRHVYAGAAGYWGYSGVMDTAIAIRTLVVRGERVFLQVRCSCFYVCLCSCQRHSMRSVIVLDSLAADLNECMPTVQYSENFRCFRRLVLESFTTLYLRVSTMRPSVRCVLP